MKRLLLFAVAWLGGLVLADAQDLLTAPSGEENEATVVEIRPGMKYREYKDFYYAGNYVRLPGDPYSPALLGIASYFVPGLGQAVAGEWGRGLRFFGGCFLSVIPGLALITYKEGAYEEAGMLMSLTGFMTCYIWNICDAARVAKIKNMYYQDLRQQRAAMDWKIEPFFAAAPKYGPAAGATPTAGLSFRITF
ncbi:MAG: hypothetical protein IJM60_05395 [Bacteroidales bacterium]|nr:hypothetical protein [Bacteroidales bacterium]